MSGPSRVVHCADAIEWLNNQRIMQGCSVVTSLPDITEQGHMSAADYKAWVTSTAQLVLSHCPDEGVTILFQTDIRVAAGTATYSRPAYHHMLCFSKGIRTTAAAATADVLPSAGNTTWALLHCCMHICTATHQYTYCSGPFLWPRDGSSCCKPARAERSWG